MPLMAGLATAGLCSWAPLQGQAQALPQGQMVVHGQASFKTSGSQLTITNSDRAILNWQSFSIAAGHTVRFDQPSASSQVLNRVVGLEPSRILGQISSNGGVWLLNSNGILFGRDARVDVAGLVASTLRISDADWQARRIRLYDGAAQAAGGPSVRNQGVLRSVTGGRIWLLGGSGGVTNDGRIEAPGGHVALAAGRSIDLIDSTLPNIAVRVQVPVGEAVNKGHIVASDGRIDLQAALVGQQGVLQADGSAGRRGGEIELRASQTVDVGAGSRTSADGAAGGRITLDAGPGDGTVSGGTAVVAGDLGARGATATGGGIRLLGNQVGLLGSARVDASGLNGGGEVLIGGGLQGRDPEVRNARAVYMAGDASVLADAHERGNGGRIVLWSNQATRVYGSLSARGGSLAGDGGLIETSGGWLDARPRLVATQAPRGKPGTWLLDPYNISIQNDFSDAGGTFIDSVPGSTPNSELFVSAAGDSRIYADWIVGAMGDGINVTITTGPSPLGLADGAGNISFTNATLDLSLPARTSLTLNATGSVTFTNSRIVADGTEPFDLFVSAGTGTAGTISLNGSSISTPAGTVSMVVGTPSIAGRYTSTERAAATGASTPSRITAASVLIRADDFLFDRGEAITGLNAGTAITLAGSAGNIRSFFAPATATALVTPAGRWLIYATDPASSSFSLGRPLADRLAFVQHAALYGSPAGEPLGAGNGLLTALTPTLTLGTSTGRPVKVYDGTTAIAGGTAGFAVGGLLSGDRLADTTTPLSVAYANRNVGTGIALAWTPGLGAAGSTVLDARGRPVYGYRVSAGTGDITPAPLTVSGLSADNKVYDATTAATLSGTGTIRPLGSDVVALSGVASARFDDKNVGNAKRVSVPSLGLTGADAGNYVLAPVTGLRADIIPAPLTVSGLSANNKVYDATTAATLSGTGTIRPLGSDAVALGGAGSASFDDKNVGDAKPVSVAGLGLTGADAGNYVLAAVTGLSANITPARLTYTADQASMFVGSALPRLGGTVSGFVADDTPGSATTGELIFATPASSLTPAGRYPILGGGLLAGNYRFVQAAGNREALLIADRLPTEAGPGTSQARVPQPALPREAWWQFADLAQLLPTGVALQGLFGPVDSAGMSPADTLAVLDARDAVSRFNQGYAMRDAQLNPQRALVPDCDKVSSAIAGVCMITEALKAEYLKLCPQSRLQCASNAVGTAQAWAAPLMLASADRTPALWDLFVGDRERDTQGQPGMPAAARHVAAERPPIVLAANGATSEPPAADRPPTRWALSIGIGEYEDKSMHGVAPVTRFFAADKDADYVGRALGLQLGYTRIPVRRPHKAEIISAFNDLAARAREQDSVVIYYAGYGQVEPSRKECYWSTSESTADSAQKWISNQTLGDYLGRIKARQVIMLVDSCFSDPAPANDDVEGRPAKRDPEAARKRAAVAIVSGTNAPLVDLQRGSHSAFAENVVSQTTALTGDLAGRELHVEVGSLLRRLLTQLPDVDAKRANKYIAVYRASKRGGHEPGADFFFRPRQSPATRPD